MAARELLLTSSVRYYPPHSTACSTKTPDFARVRIGSMHVWLNASRSTSSINSLTSPSCRQNPTGNNANYPLL
jgi:hypothetical protein